MEGTLSINCKMSVFKTVRTTSSIRHMLATFVTLQLVILYVRFYSSVMFLWLYSCGMGTKLSHLLYVSLHYLVKFLDWCSVWNIVISLLAY